MTMAFDADTDLSDETLMVLYANGDRHAALALTRRITPRVMGYAARMLGGDRSEAEDVAQETMLRLWRLAPEWRQGETRVTTWAYRVATNLCIDRQRSRQRRGQVSLDSVPDPEDRAASAEARLQRAGAPDCAGDRAGGPARPATASGGIAPHKGTSPTPRSLRSWKSVWRRWKALPREGSGRYLPFWLLARPTWDMRMTTMHDREVDDLLALAAATRPAPTPDLLDRVLADALAVQPHAAARVPPAPPRWSGLLERLSRAFGGGAVLAGVTSTLLLGLVVGYVNPAALDYLTGGSAEVVDLFPDTEFLTTEG